MKRHILSIALAFTTAQLAAAQGGSPSTPTPATLPATALGRLTQQLLDAIEGGDFATITRFVDQNLGRDVRGRTPAQMADLFVKLHAQSNGLRIERTMMAGSALRMMAKSRDGKHMLGMELEPEPGDSTRIASVTLVAMDPAQMGGPPKPWAEGR